MNEKQRLKALVVYAEPKNEYTISDHNLDEQKAAEFMNEYQPHLREGCTFIALDQNKQHKTADAQTCRICRSDVRRVLGSKLSVMPKFKRRNQ